MVETLIGITIGFVIGQLIYNGICSIINKAKTKNEDNSTVTSGNRSN